MKARLALGIGANLYGQSITIAVQVVSVPVLIHAWGSARFGLWVLLSAVPMALSFADGGIVLASGNAMVMAVARGETRQAAGLFRRAFRIIGLMALLVAGLAGVLLILLPATALPGASIGVPTQTAPVLFVLSVVVLLGLLSSLISAGFRASGRYALGVAANDSIRLAESVAVLAVAASGGDLGGAAMAWLMVRVVGLGLSAAALVRLAPWIRLRSQDHDRVALRTLIHPAMASLAIPAAFAVSLQGATIAVGIAMTPSAVALFAASRTLTRAMVQASGLINHALMPEMSMAAGREDKAGMAALSRLSFGAALGVLLPAWVAMVVLGPRIMDVWTGQHLRVDPMFLAVMATAALIHGLWLSAANLLLAINRQADYAWAFLMIATLSVIPLPALAGKLGLVGAALALLAGDCAMGCRLMAIRRRDIRTIRLVLREVGP